MGRRALLAGLVMAAAMSPAAGQSADVTGDWACEFTVQDSSLHRPSFRMAFDMQVLPGGQARGDGVMTTPNGDYPMTFEGTWLVNLVGFGIQGQRTDAFGTTAFSFGSNIVSETEMAMTADAADGNVVTSSCRRTD